LNSKNINRCHGSPLHILAFFDGRLGHEKQTKGILKSVSRLTPTAVSNVVLSGFSPGTCVLNWLRFLGTFLLPARNTVSRFQVDLILGTGSHTHIPMLLCKRKCGARVVTCMTPSFFLKNRIDLCFIPKHDRPREGHNVLITEGPPNTAVPSYSHDRRRGLILVGGVDEKSHHWDTGEILSMIQYIIYRNPLVTWTLSSSPRTPADTVGGLADLAENETNAAFFRCDETPDGWIEKEYAGNDSVWITADSMSMVYEALTAGCRVGILPVRWKRKDCKFQRSLNDLMEAGRVTAYDDWKTGCSELNRGETLDEAGRCAREILHRWWPERLGS